MSATSFDGTPTSSPLLSSLFRPRDGALPVIDPQLKHLGRFWIDLRKVMKTYGLCRYQGNHPHPPSLCLLYQEGRCNAGGKCNQIHVKRSHMKNLHKALNAMGCANCCAAHGDIACGRVDVRAFLTDHLIEVLMPDGSTVHVPSESIAITHHWERFLAAETQGRVVHVPFSRICNLHQHNQCRYGVDCRNVHVCRELGAVLFAGQLTVAEPPQFAPEQEEEMHQDCYDLPTQDAVVVDEPLETGDCTPVISGNEEPLPHAPCLTWDLIESPNSPLHRDRSSSFVGEPLGLRTESMDTLTSPVTPMTRLLSSFTRVLATTTDSHTCRLPSYLQASQAPKASPDAAKSPRPSSPIQEGAARRLPIAGKDLHRLLPAEIPHGSTPARAVAGAAAAANHQWPSGKRPRTLRGPNGGALWNRANLFGVGAAAPSSTPSL